MAGVLSFNSFGIFQPRFTVKWLDKNGRESTFPTSRYHIAKFLEGGQPNLRIYARPHQSSETEFSSRRSISTGWGSGRPGITS
jgi:hypothetical protein